LRFSLPSGAYTVSVTVLDGVAKQHGTALQRVLVAGKP
jgi:hypothetical protein